MSSGEFAQQKTPLHKEPQPLRVNDSRRRLEARQRGSGFSALANAATLNDIELAH